MHLLEIMTLVEPTRSCFLSCRHYPSAFRSDFGSATDMVVTLKYAQRYAVKVNVGGERASVDIRG